MRELPYYGDPKRYDAEYGFVAADLNWYRDQVMKPGGPALVLGCGTGRVLFCLAQSGIAVTGIDNSPAMLDRARTRALTLARDHADRVDLIEADIRLFSLDRHYQTILAPLNLLMHLHTDQEVQDCLACVKNHLLENGRFIFDISNPREEILVEHGGPHGLPLREIVVEGVNYLQRERHLYDPLTRISEVAFIFESLSAGAESFITRLVKTVLKI